MQLKKIPPSITAILTTYNERLNILSCLESLRYLTDNIIVVDTSSTDDTSEIAKKYGVKVYEFPYTKVVEPARNFAISRSNGDWIFIIDADERMTKVLAEEIKIAVTTSNYSHFELPRKNIFAKKKWLRNGGWYPDYVLRLFQKKDFVNWPSVIHSYPQISGKKGRLKEGLLHYFHSNLEDMVSKTIIYEEKVATLLYEARRKVEVKTLFRKFLGEFWKRFFKKLGIVDGSYGLIENMYQAYSQTITWLFLYEKYQNEKSSNL